MLLFLASHLLALLLLAATAYVAGRLVLRGGLETDVLERFAVASTLGLVLLAHLLFALGSLGLLSRWPLIAGLLILHSLGFRAWREMIPGRLLAGLALASAPLFVLSLYPPTGFDETLYHLPYARAFVRTGAIPFLPELRYPVFPQLDELLSAGMMLLADDVATHLIRLLMTLLTAALLAAWGRRVFSPGAGWLAAGLFLGNPIVVHLASSGYVEPALNLFAAAALYSLDRWREGGRRWLVLAAVFAASAAGIKYLGLFFVVAVLAAALPAAIRDRRLRDLGIAAAVCLAVLAPTYGRILAATGNPLFPFYPGVFGSNLWAPDSVAGRSLEARGRGLRPLPAGRAPRPRCRGQPASVLPLLSPRHAAARPRVLPRPAGEAASLDVPGLLARLLPPASGLPLHDRPVATAQPGAGRQRAAAVEPDAAGPGRARVPAGLGLWCVPDRAGGAAAGDGFGPPSLPRPRAADLRRAGPSEPSARQPLYRLWAVHGEHGLPRRRGPARGLERSGALLRRGARDHRPGSLPSPAPRARRRIPRDPQGAWHPAPEGTGVEPALPPDLRGSARRHL